MDKKITPDMFDNFGIISRDRDMEERNINVCLDIVNGMKFSQVGERHSLSVTRVDQIYYKYTRRIGQYLEAHYGPWEHSFLDWSHRNKAFISPQGREAFAAYKQYLIINCKNIKRRMSMLQPSTSDGIRLIDSIDFSKWPLPKGDYDFWKTGMAVCAEKARGFYYKEIAEEMKITEESVSRVFKYFYYFFVHNIGEAIYEQINAKKYIFDGMNVMNGDWLYLIDSYSKYLQSISTQETIPSKEGLFKKLLLDIEKLSRQIFIPGTNEYCFQQTMIEAAKEFSAAKLGKQKIYTSISDA